MSTKEYIAVGGVVVEAEVRYTKKEISEAARLSKKYNKEITPEKYREISKRAKERVHNYIKKKAIERSSPITSKSYVKLAKAAGLKIVDDNSFEGKYVTIHLHGVNSKGSLLLTINSKATGKILVTRPQSKMYLADVFKDLKDVKAVERKIIEIVDTNTGNE